MVHVGSFGEVLCNPLKGVLLEMNLDGLQGIEFASALVSSILLIIHFQDDVIFFFLQCFKISRLTVHLSECLWQSLLGFYDGLLRF